MVKFPNYSIKITNIFTLCPKQTNKREKQRLIATSQRKFNGEKQQHEKELTFEPLQPGNPGSPIGPSNPGWPCTDKVNGTIIMNLLIKLNDLMRLQILFVRTTCFIMLNFRSNYSRKIF